jgi:hypothetical protein
MVMAKARLALATVFEMAFMAIPLKASGLVVMGKRKQIVDLSVGVSDGFARAAQLTPSRELRDVYE